MGNDHSTGPGLLSSIIIASPALGGILLRGPFPYLNHDGRVKAMYSYMFGIPHRAFNFLNNVETSSIVSFFDEHLTSTAELMIMNTIGAKPSAL